MDFLSNINLKKNTLTKNELKGATNFAGTAYGEEISFSTIQPVLPTLSHFSVTDIRCV